jgi:prepilin-type N-terminal cleavage/methylation domain-containing protein
MKNNKNSASGFTLLELLVALAIIAILIAVAIPSFRAVQTEIKISRAQSELRMLQGAVETYYKDFGRYPGNPYSCYGWNWGDWEGILINCSPHLIDNILHDPFNSYTPPDNEYGYSTSETGKYYVIYSGGPQANSSNRTGFFCQPHDSGVIDIAGPGIIWVSNVPGH